MARLAKSLFQLALGEHHELTSFHPLDTPRLQQLAVELNAVGECQSLAEASRELDGVWATRPHARTPFLRWWRVLLANPAHRFRQTDSRGPRWTPYRSLDRIARTNGLTPIHERLEAQAQRAVRELAGLCDDRADLAAFVRADRRAQFAINEVRRYRSSRFGEAVVYTPTRMRRAYGTELNAPGWEDIGDLTPPGA